VSETVLAGDEQAQKNNSDRRRNLWSLRFLRLATIFYHLFQPIARVPGSLKRWALSLAGNLDVNYWQGTDKKNSAAWCEC